MISELPEAGARRGSGLPTLDIREELSNSEFVAFTVFLQGRRRNKLQNNG
jgi:hypothetical protein